MSFSGRIEDVSAADLFQFVQMGQRSGTLVFRRGELGAEIAFHRGAIVNARIAGMKRLGQLLVESGALKPEHLARALEQQAAATPRPSLGQVLIEEGMVPAETMYAAVREQFAWVVRELLAWKTGRFEFLLDDIRPADELSIQPGDLVPQVHLDTQAALMDALRIFDEQARDGHALPAAPSPPVQSCEPPPVAPSLPRVQMVSTDRALREQLSSRLAGQAQVVSVPLREAGLPAPGEAPPLVVLDLRGGRTLVDAVGTLHRTRPRARLVVVAAGDVDQLSSYAAGAVAFVPPSAEMLAACVHSLLSLRSDGPARPDVRRDLLKVRRVLGDLQSGLITTSISLSLMNVISESLERAVLLLAARDQLVALGAFGAGAAGRPLAQLTQGLRLRVDGSDLLGQSLGDGRLRTADAATAPLPQRLRSVLGAVSGQCAVLPVTGGTRVVALVYVDNGARPEPLEDLDILELATAQAGLAFENELLRRRLPSA